MSSSDASLRTKMKQMSCWILQLPSAGFLFFAAATAGVAKSRALLQLNTTEGKKQNKKYYLSSQRMGQNSNRLRSYIRNGTGLCRTLILWWQKDNLRFSWIPAWTFQRCTPWGCLFWATVVIVVSLCNTAESYLDWQRGGWEADAWEAVGRPLNPAVDQTAGSPRPQSVLKETGVLLHVSDI